MTGPASPRAEQLYTELHRLAGQVMRGERADHTLQPTALVHEAFLRLGDADDVAESREHLLALAARTMRRVLVDHARSKRAQKRQDDRGKVTLRDDAELLESTQLVDFLDIEQALTQLAEQDERKARVVELRFYGGLTFAESAALLDISPKTVEADWYMARAWLRRALKGGRQDSRD